MFYYFSCIWFLCRSFAQSFFSDLAAYHIALYSIHKFCFHFSDVYVAAWGCISPAMAVTIGIICSVLLGLCISIYIYRKKSQYVQKNLVCCAVILLFTHPFTAILSNWQSSAWHISSSAWVLFYALKRDPLLDAFYVTEYAEHFVLFSLNLGFIDITMPFLDNIALST